MMRSFYYRFIYRRLMRVAHRYDWHHTRTVYPDGDTMLVCDWCGLRYVSHRRPLREATETTGPYAAEPIRSRSHR